jgi:hypothetical protein
LRDVIKAVVLTASTILSPVGAQAGWFGGPSDYDECILESMKGVKSDVAARAIVKSCREKFPPVEKAPQGTRELTPSEISKLNGRAGLQTYSSSKVFFKVDLYNGNSQIAVSEITFVITTTDSGEKSTRRYRRKINIEPLSKTDLGIEILEGGSINDLVWAISSARGYRAH